MRLVGRVYLRVTQSGRSISISEIESIVRSEGWKRVHGRKESKEDWSSFHSSGTPLMLVATVSKTTGRLELGLIEKWWRCTLAGGWMKPGMMPEDFFERIAARMRGNNWTVE